MTKPYQIPPMTPERMAALKARILDIEAGHPGFIERLGATVSRLRGKRARRSQP